MTATTHIAGIDVTVGHQLRQRCAWCGTVLLDYDLTRIAVLDGDDPRPGTWAVGALVHSDGHAAWSDAKAVDMLPDDACARAHPELTA